MAGSIQFDVLLTLAGSETGDPLNSGLPILYRFDALDDFGKEKGMALTSKPNARRAVIIFGGLTLLGALLIALFYAEEDWRGKRAWEKCKRELEAKGEVLDWNAYIPPLVPDDQNIFKAPKMAKWFVKPKPGSQATNDLAARLSFGEFSRRFPNASSATIAELTVMASSNYTIAASNIADIKLRYSSYGSAFFLQEDVIETNAGANNFNIPRVDFALVPLDFAITNLAYHAGITYVLDSNVVSELPLLATATARWEGITARQALLALLNHYGLQLIDHSTNGIARITRKDASESHIFIPSEIQRPLLELLDQSVGTNALGSQGPVLLTGPAARIRPVRILCRSEGLPPDTELVKLFTELFPNGSAKLGSPRIWVESSGTNAVRVMVDAVTASDYLAWSDQFEPDFNLVREVLKRPFARMDGDYSQWFTMPIPDYVSVRAVVQTLAQRAQCYLLLGQPEKALPELTFLNDSRRLLESAPTGKPMTLVATMIDAAVVDLYADTITEGMRLGAWHEPQLIELQQQRDELKLSLIAESFRAERAGMCSYFEQLLSHDTGVWEFVKSESHLAMPRGWLYLNLITIAKFHQDVLDVIDVKQNTVLSHKVDEITEGFDARTKHFRPNTYVAAIVIPNYTRAIVTFAHSQTLANEAQVVCALERYRLAHNQYPESLEALIPLFMEKLPRDVIDGEPLHYRRQANGTFLLYSVGWNETDDGGQVALKKDGSEDREKGDWVWKNPAR